MSIIENLFPSVVITPEEETLLLEVFKNPVVRKYLKSLGVEATKELLSLDTISESPESLQKKHTLVAGKLSVISMFLSIKD